MIWKAIAKDGYPARDQYSAFLVSSEFHGYYVASFSVESQSWFDWQTDRDLNGLSITHWVEIDPPQI